MSMGALLALVQAMHDVFLLQYLGAFLALLIGTFGYRVS